MIHHDSSHGAPHDASCTTQTKTTYLGNTSDHVLNERLDGTQARNVLTGTVPDGEDDLVGLGGLDLYDQLLLPM